MLAALRPGMEHGADDDEGEDADRQVDVEDPAPAEVVDEKAAEQRADDRRNAEHGAEETLVLAAFAWRDDVADDRQRRHDQAAAPEALQGPERDQFGHVLADPAERGADQEDGDRRLQDDLPTIEISELSVERAGDRRGQQVGGDDPGEVLDPAEVADDRGQRGRDDRLVERGQQQDEQQRAEDHAQARLALFG